jgi:hypothetical protein
MPRILFVVLPLALAAALTGAILWAFTAADFWESFGRIVADPWGVVSLVDLYVGFVLFAMVIYAVERGRPIAFAFILPTFLLGNVVPAVWLAYRAGRLLSASEADGPSGGASRRG